jgi:hypothetical protein
MKNENHPKFLGLVGKVISQVHLSNSHGDIVMLKFTDGTKFSVCSYANTGHDEKHSADELFVSVNDEEL